MTRYHKDIFFPDNDKLPVIVSNLNQRKWALSKHSFDRIIEKSKDIENVGNFLKNVYLEASQVFEYYKENDFIFKLVFRLNFDNEKDIILVLNSEKEIVTVYYNNKEDNHRTLDNKIYSLC